MSYTLDLVRHGTSLAYVNYENDDVPTYRQGHDAFKRCRQEDSHAAGKQVAIYRPTLLVSSQLVRAKQSADIIAEYSPLFVNTDWQLERNQSPVCRWSKHLQRNKFGIQKMAKGND